MEISSRRPIADLRTPSMPAGFAQRWGFGVRRPAVVLGAALAVASLIGSSPAMAEREVGPAQGNAVQREAVTRSIDDRLSPAALWGADKDILVMGEAHRAVEQSRVMLAALPDLKASGMTDLAMELPAECQRTLDRYARGKASVDDLSRGLYHLSYDKLPEGFQLKVDMVRWASANGVKVHAIDADKHLLHESASARAQAIARGVPMPMDERDIAAVQARGIAHHHRHLTAIEAQQEGWRLWIHARSAAMAKNIEAIQEKSGGKTVAVVGATHTGFHGFRQAFLSQGCDVRTTPNEGIKDLLPDSLRSKAQTLLLLGGAQRTAAEPINPRDLHTLEAQIIKRGLGNEPRAIRQVNGLPGVDSAIFIPNTTSATSGSTMASVARE